MKREKKIVKKYDGEWPPEDSAGFITWFQSKLADVPEEFRSSVLVELGSARRYDSSYATIEFSYVRQETDEEEAQRKQQDAAQSERRRADELRTLAALQAKYGNPA